MGALELSVLGPVTATLDGAAVHLGGPRQRAVVAVLVAARAQTVSADQLLADVWSTDDPPGTGTLHSSVSQLRTVLEPDRARDAPPAVLVRRGPGYALVVPPGAVDAGRFTDLATTGARALAAGDHGRAVPALTAALELWRGPAYADVADLEALRPEVTRLTELRLAATEDLLAARLAAGEHAEVAAAARAHTARHPLRERGWELLALALYRSGRQADALAALRTVRGVLAEELGLDPGPALRGLETAVLAQDPGLVPAVDRPDPAPVLPGAAGGPPARTPGSPAPVPVPLTDLVGRDALVTAVTAALTTSRLLTLTGPGGVGKTRVAVEVARRADAGEGPWWVELASLEDPGLLATTVAGALAIPGAGDAAQVAAVVGDRRGLLVLDNCEHLVDAVAELAATLLGRCPGLRVLTTSRTTLDVIGEAVWEVPPLDATGAVELFGRRARAVLPGWSPGPVERATVARVCADLDGLPLAVELAAARMRVLSAEQIAVGMADRFATLGSGGRGVPPRQGGLERTADWSYRELGDGERDLFRRLAVFAGPFDLEGAAAVSPAPGDDRVAATLPLLWGLVRRSLVSVEPDASPRRYRLLETLRHFALSRADAAEVGQAQVLHRRHVLRRALAAERRLRGPAGTEALAELRRDRPEHRAALASAVACGDAAYQLDLVGALSWAWYRDGALHEGLAAARAALAGAGPQPSPADDLRRARASHGLGGLLYLSGEGAGSEEALLTAATLAGRAGDATVEARAAAWAAHLASLLGRQDAGRRVARAVQLARSSGEPGVLAEALMVGGMACRARGSTAAARPVLAEAVRTAEVAGHSWAAISSTWALMKAAVDDGRLDDALAAAASMVGPLEADGDVTSWLVLVHTTAAVLASAGEPEGAARLLGAVAAHGARAGFSPELMDPVDGPREAAAVRGAVPGEVLGRHLAEGALLSREEVSRLLGELLERALAGSATARA